MSFLDEVEALVGSAEKLVASQGFAWLRTLQESSKADISSFRPL